MLTTFALFAFWIAAATIAYTYVGYPALVIAASRLWARDHAIGPAAGPASIVMTVHNEERNIARRIAEFRAMMERSPGVDAELIVVCDGSTDATEAVARAAAGPNVTVLALERNRGKAVALNEGVRASRGDIIVLADARQRWADDAMIRLLENFADPTVGAVSGELVLEQADGVLAGVGLYWRFEKALRRAEARLGSQIGVTGAICAVRRALFPAEIPEGTVLDDVYWPLTVVMRGHRVVNDDRAKAFDRLPPTADKEFERKVRTLSGNFQLVSLLPRAFLPWTNPAWFAFMSHKILRLVVPWAMIALFLASLALDGTFYRLALAAQILVYVLVAESLWLGASRRLPLVGVLGSLMLLNAAAFVAFWVWITGSSSKSWTTVTYATPPE
jgi:glycosyltransferase involved in cell wall biosynthesis